MQKYYCTHPCVLLGCQLGKLSVCENRRIFQNKVSLGEDRGEYQLHLHGSQARAQAVAVAPTEREVLMRTESSLQEALRAECERLGVEFFAPMHQIGDGATLIPACRW